MLRFTAHGKRVTLLMLGLPSTLTVSSMNRRKLARRILLIELRYLSHALTIQDHIPRASIMLGAERIQILERP